MSTLEFFLLALLCTAVATLPILGHAIGHAKGRRQADNATYQRGNQDGYRRGYRDGTSDAVDSLSPLAKKRLDTPESVTRPMAPVPVSVDGDEGEPFPPKRAVTRPE